MIINKKYIYKSTYISSINLKITKNIGELAFTSEQPQIAEVVEVGPGGIVEGKEIKMELTVGDKVIFQKYSGTEVKIEGQEYTILRQSDVLAVIE
ncbi:co-chaperone GroES [Clostridioides difficile]|uniref:co-chaperone GroES n=1 Tax=Clostridioides difficile TaxID=1496 RepID=UPI002ED5F712